jgi:AraC-like DNA-binding protein
MPGDAPLSLYDPRLGEPSFALEPIGADFGNDTPRRSNCFTIIWVRHGAGTFWADLAQHRLEPHTLLFLAPYQLFRLAAAPDLSGVVIQFHANFFCIETHHAEVGCNGVLFNDPYGAPIVRMDTAFEQRVADLVQAMRHELDEAGLAHGELLLSYLKILLVSATRLKLERPDGRGGWSPGANRPAALDEFAALIETHYRKLHKPSEYAALLHVAPKSLARLVKTHLHKTPTELIRERLVRQAKWELLHTAKPVKQVALELGFDDVFYFSRLFKRAAGCSPTFFREYETAIRGGRNLAAPWGR